jgi:hypothetical protein
MTHEWHSLGFLKLGNWNPYKYVSSQIFKRHNAFDHCISLRISVYAMLLITYSATRFGMAIVSSSVRVKFTYCIAPIYRAYTKEWCGFKRQLVVTAPFFCVCPVLFLKCTG